MKIKFPLWQFLNQPVFSATQQTIWNPRRFSYSYRINMLERCWSKNHEPEGRHR